MYSAFLNSPCNLHEYLSGVLEGHSKTFSWFFDGFGSILCQNDPPLFNNVEVWVLTVLPQIMTESPTQTLSVCKQTMLKENNSEKKLKFI